MPWSAVSHLSLEKHNTCPSIKQKEVSRVSSVFHPAWLFVLSKPIKKGLSHFVDYNAEPQMGQVSCPRSHRQAKEDPDLWLESRLLQTVPPGPGCTALAEAMSENLRLGS